MGVPLLLTWLRSSFARCFFPAEGEMAKVISGNVDNLYIDLNSLLYQSSTIVSVGRGHFRTVEEVEDAVLRKLYDLLDDIIFHLVQPKALVYIAVDGISPLGKMSQQRSRRHRQSERRNHHHHGGQRRFDADDARDGHGVMKESMDTLWDNNCITVGTRFMTKVTEALHAYAVSRTEKMNVKRFQEATRAMERDVAKSEESAVVAPEVPVFTPLAIVIDDVLRPGEGENKILEVIRHFREQPNYSPNLLHVICSSDTDVTVSSLLLHEPRMFVLRYEPPASLGGRDPVFATSRAGPSPAGTVDSWLSTFFSIYLFREGLRKLLGLAPIEIDIPGAGGGKGKAKKDAKNGFPAVPDVTPEASTAFERALHDVVFVMLLFGNDFLPTLGGSIKEGMLDALLALLASDFVSRGRSIVDPETNHIHFASARYLLECLSDIRGQGSSGVLAIHGDDTGRGRHHHSHGGNGHHSGAASAGGGIGTDWGFTDDAEFQQRKRERERRVERKCYCYWTMLQWALQYSAGVVDHWGCYYPFPDAPPLYALKKYCGVLSYDALVKFVASRHAAQQAGRDMDDLDLPAAPTSGAEPVEECLASRPTDAMVQLLVLTPQSSSALLPTVFRNGYDEIAAAVLAPVEKLDIGLVERWCDEKKKLLSEEERTRFDAYQLFSSPAPLVPAHHDHRVGGVDGRGGPPADEATEDALRHGAPMKRRRCLPANEVTFMAYWDGGMLAKELDDYARHLQESRLKQRELEEQQQQQQQKQKQQSVAAPALVAAAGRAAASFFGVRKPKGAAAAALLQAPRVPPPPPPPPAPQPLSAADAPEVPTAPPAEPPAEASTIKEPTPAAETPVTRDGGADSAALALVSNPVQSIFFFAAAIGAYLPSDTLVRAMGYLDGPRFVIGGVGGGSGGASVGAAAAASSAASRGGGSVGASAYGASAVPLSRDTRGHQVRLQWRLAVAAPALTGVTPTATVDGVIVSSLDDEDIVDPNVTIPHALAARTGLLDGYVPPSIALTLSVKEVIAAKRAAEEARARGEDPWKAMAVKRQRTESSRT